MNFEQKQEKLKGIIEGYPSTFGLVHYDGIFRVAPLNWNKCYISDGKVNIVVQVSRDGKWLDFLRCYDFELEAHIVKRG